MNPNRDFISFLLAASIALGLLFTTPALAKSVFDNLQIRHGNQYLGDHQFTTQNEQLADVTTDLVEELARRMKLNIKSSLCPFKRCIRHLRDGDLDIMMLLAVNEERAEHYHFIQVWPSTQRTVFFMRPGETQNLQKYDDLYRLKIGMVNGYAYSPKLDNDPNIKRTLVLTEQQLAKILRAGRIDAFATYTSLQKKLQKQHPTLITAPLTLPYGKLAMFAISKRSPLSEHLDDIEAHALKMITDGTADRLWQQHYPGDRMPYPEHLMTDAQ